MPLSSLLKLPLSISYSKASLFNETLLEVILNSLKTSPIAVLKIAIFIYIRYFSRLVQGELIWQKKKIITKN